MNWKFNQGRAPWWSGKFEWMIGLMKQTLYKAMGNAHLTMVEMQEAMLYIEINMSNWSLTYLVDNIEQPILTPKNLLLHWQIINVPDVQLESNPITNIKSNNPDIRKRAVRLHAGVKNYLEWPIQHFYPLKRTSDVTATSKLSDEKTLDTEFIANASEFKPKCNDAAIARLKMQDEFESKKDLNNTE